MLQRLQQFTQLDHCPVIVHTFAVQRKLMAESISKLVKETDGTESVKNQIAIFILRRYRSDGTHLSDEISVKSKSNVGRVTPIDNGDTRPVSGHVQSLDDPLDKVQHVVPSLSMHCTARMEHEHKIHFSAAYCNTIATDATQNHDHTVNCVG